MKQREMAERNYQKFRETGQSGIKLDCALMGFLELTETTEEEQEAYMQYLKLRIRPAAQLLVREDDTEKLQKLYELGGFTEQLLKELISAAGEEGKLSSLAWLLRLKKETYGYREHEYSL